MKFTSKGSEQLLLLCILYVNPPKKVHIYPYKRYFAMYVLLNTLLALVQSDKSNIIKYSAQFSGGVSKVSSYLAHTSVFFVKYSALAWCACSTLLHKLHKFHSRLGLENLIAHICKFRSLQLPHSRLHPIQQLKGLKWLYKPSIDQADCRRHVHLTI